MGPEAWVSVNVVVFIKNSPHRLLPMFESWSRLEEEGLRSTVVQPDLLAGSLLFCHLTIHICIFSDTMDYIPPNLESK